jgi:hypothetical protein
MPAYDSTRGQLVRLQAKLLNILERMVVAQRRTNFWVPWCVYFHNCLALRTLSRCVVAFILFCDEVEGCIGVYTDWHESKAEIFHQVQYGELATFHELVEWVNRFGATRFPRLQGLELTTCPCRSSTEASFRWGPIPC